jgi:hypothetical protein
MFDDSPEMILDLRGKASEWLPLLAAWIFFGPASAFDDGTN